MPEVYTISVEGQGIAFALRQENVSRFVELPVFDPEKAPKGLSLVCRMGSPDLVHCVIFRHDDKPGGIFAVHDRDGFLFAAVAESNLAYALAKGFFGSLVANARYGVDIFEAGEND